MPNYFDRLVEYHKAFGTDYLVVGGVPWITEQRAIVPTGPACHDYSLSPDDEDTLLAHFKRAALVVYTDGFQSAEADSPWYSVTCNRFLDLGDYNAHFRSMIRRGLKHCAVRKVDAEYVARHGFGVYKAAYARYQNTALPDVSETAWRDRVLLNREFPDLREYWAVHVGDRLVGYSANWIFDKTEAAYSQIKIDPEFLNAYPSYALFFTMNQYYLRDQSFAYVNDGFKNIGHLTGIQDFLIEKFGFQKASTNLYARYRFWVSAALSIPSFAKRFLSKHSRNYAALCEIERARMRTGSKSPSRLDPCTKTD